MGKFRGTKLASWADKLAVESEPGLTNGQLMLHNHDLKPVELERRQWGPWNFVGFWVADSFNILPTTSPSPLLPAPRLESGVLSGPSSTGLLCLRCASCRNVILYLGRRESPRAWADCSPTRDLFWLKASLGNGYRYHVRLGQLCYSHC
ncbi:unnamed protein product, partial [Diplocarpon coronariae]